MIWFYLHGAGVVFFVNERFRLIAGRTDFHSGKHEVLIDSIQIK
jgi:hypothetical protein